MNTINLFVFASMLFFANCVLGSPCGCCYNAPAPQPEPSPYCYYKQQVNPISCLCNALNAKKALYEQIKAQKAAKLQALIAMELQKKQQLVQLELQAVKQKTCYPVAPVPAPCGPIFEHLPQSECVQLQNNYDDCNKGLLRQKFGRLACPSNICQNKCVCTY